MSDEPKPDTVPLVGEEPKPAVVIPGQGMTDEKLGIWECPDEQYYADNTALSCSMMRHFKESPRLFEATYLTKTAPVKPKSDALLIGNAFHDALLRPEAFKKNYVIQPKFGRKKAELEAKARWEEENASRLVLTEKETALIEGMMNGLNRNKMVRGLIDHPDRRVELAVRWQVDTGFDIWEHHTGRHRESKAAFPRRLVLKAKYDIVIPGFGMIDVKTIADLNEVSKVERHFGDYGYHIREQWYSMGAEATGLVDPKDDYAYLFVAVSKEFPHDCVVFSLNESFGHLARRQIEEKLTAYSASVLTGEWKHLGETDFVTLNPPKYLFQPNY